jgi:sugar phosphate isomerase/epimerase
VAPTSENNTMPPRLGIQAHCLRQQLARDLHGTLGELARLGFGAIELAAFPGCRGNPWGDFGALADAAPEAISDALVAAGFIVPSTHISWREAQDEHFDATVAWLRGVGTQRAILASIPIPANASFEQWRAALERLNEIGMRFRESGLDFGYHTQANLWQMCDGARPADSLLEIIDPRCCLIEFDPTGTLIYGMDPAAYLRGRPDGFYALHLRDGRCPEHVVPHLYAQPLGEGEIDFRALLKAAAATSMQWHFLEMEMASPEAVMAAIQASLRYLQHRLSDERETQDV